MGRASQTFDTLGIYLLLIGRLQISLLLASSPSPSTQPRSVLSVSSRAALYTGE